MRLPPITELPVLLGPGCRSSSSVRSASSTATSARALSTPCARRSASVGCRSAKRPFSACFLSSSGRCSSSSRSSTSPSSCGRTIKARAASLRLRRLPCVVCARVDDGSAGDRARDGWRRAVLRRRHHHPGHLGAQRRGGAEGRDTCVRTLRRADRDRDPGRAVPGAASRHGGHRQAVRSHNVHLVCHAGRARPMADPRGSKRSAGAQPRLRGRLFASHGWQAFVALGACCPGGDRGRGAVRRHGALWPVADPVCLVQLCPAGAPAQLLRPGGAPDPRPRRGRQPLLSACASLGALSHGRAGDLGARS